MRRLRPLIVLVLLAFGFPLGVLANETQLQNPIPAPPKASQKPETKPAEREEASSDNKRGTEDSPFFIKVIPPLSIEPESTKKEEETRDYTSAEWWLVYVTVALCAITLVLAFFTGFLWYATKKLVTGAEDTARRQLRAYLCVSHVERVENTSSPEICAFQIKILNSGQTPAYSIKTWRGIGTDKYPLTAKLPAPENATPTTDVTLGSGAVHTFVSERTMPLTEWEKGARSGGDAAIYFWGRFEYQDAFKANHFTNFCLYYRDGEGLNYTDTGNDAD